ncbi:MAG: DUF2442 domain-containing protein [Coriobacteriales bacterium]|jgi:hypothetical protein|nr:DUF2442 domain-containing protein [Coriobacteriales bacterium]
MEFQRPVRAEPLDDYRIRVVFENGERKVFDVTPYLEDSFWASLRQPEVFRLVKVGPLSLEWPNGIDICPEEVYFDSRPE